MQKAGVGTGWGSAGVKKRLTVKHYQLWKRAVCGIICIWINPDSYKLKRIIIMSMFTKTVIASTIKSMGEALKIDGQANDVRNMAIQKLVDVMTIKRGTMATKDFLKGNAITNPARAAVKQLFDTLVEKGLLSTQTGKIYATNFWIAFSTDVPFSPALSNQKSKTKKGAQTEKKTPEKKTPSVTIVVSIQTVVDKLTAAHSDIETLIKAGDTTLTIKAQTVWALIKELNK